MRLQLYGHDSNVCIPEYSIISNLLFDIIAQTPNRDLLPLEKLFVVRTIGLPVHAGYLADVYLACGCFAEARENYLTPEHPRKLGDICWCEGKLDQAEVYYSQAESEAQPYRSAPDDDRLIKLAFFQEHWEEVVARFANASYGRWYPPSEVTLGKSVVKAQPYLDMLAVAICHLNSRTPTQVLSILESSFGLSEKQWHCFRLKPIHLESKRVAALKARCRPRLGASEVLSVEEALRRGNTARGRHVLAYVQQADQCLESAQRAVEKFVETGEETELERFLSFVTGSGIASLSQSFLFAALGHDSFPGTDAVPTERLVRLFSSHPVMDKRHLGRLLDLRFKNKLPLTASDVLTGIFQMLDRPDPSTDRGKAYENELFLSIPRLASCREWARIRLEEWLRSRGAERAGAIAQTWREGKVLPATHTSCIGVVGAPDSPRNMTEWNALMADALMWLQRRWKHEIGSSPWVTENQLYQILRRLLKGMEVVQHARPTWLEPQHLDVYVPQAGIAVEYMGRQHFEPLEFFGGEAAFQLVVERDRNKARLCTDHGVELIRVRFDEDVGMRAKEIAKQINQL